MAITDLNAMALTNVERMREPLPFEPDGPVLSRSDQAALTAIANGEIVDASLILTDLPYPDATALKDDDLFQQVADSKTPFVVLAVTTFTSEYGADGECWRLVFDIDGTVWSKLLPKEGKVRDPQMLKMQQLFAAGARGIGPCRFELVETERGRKPYVKLVAVRQDAKQTAGKKH